MDDVTITEAEARLSELLTRVENGETIRIKRGGKLIAQLAPVHPTQTRIDVDTIKAVTDTLPMTDGDVVTRLRNEARY